MPKGDYRIEGNAFNEERVSITGKRSRGLGPGPKWPTERKDAKVLLWLIAVPLIALILLVKWLAR